MSVSVTYDDTTRTGTVTIRDGVDSSGKAVTGTENLLLQLAIDRASANTARVSIMQTQLQDQSDRINAENWILTKLLNATTSDPAKDAGSFSLLAPPGGQYFTADEQTLLGQLKDDRGATLLSYFNPQSIANTQNLTLASGKSMNDLQAALKSQLNQATNLNQQTMINYQSLINQRNQMSEWVANLITLLASAAAATTQNLR